MKSKGITLKYIVIGDSGVGKTNLLVRYCEDTFHSDYLSTIGVDFKIKRIDYEGQSVTLNIWDTAGQQRFRNITKSFYKGAHGILLTFSITDVDSFQHIENWVDQIKQSGNSTMKILLVATKIDMQKDRKVTEAQAKQLAEKYQMQYIQTSAKENINVAEVFTMLTKSILESDVYQQKLQQSKLQANSKVAINNKKSEQKSMPECCK